MSAEVPARLTELTPVIRINYCWAVVPTSLAAGRRVDRRFVVAAVALPGGLAILAGPLLSAMARLSGHGVSDGAVTLNTFIAVVAGCGVFVTATLIFLAIGHRLPLERPRYGPMPLTFACAVFAAIICAGPLPMSTPAWVSVPATLAGLAFGALLGHRAANGLLEFDGLAVTTAPAPPGVERYAITERSTAVWTGRLPVLRATTWLVPLAFVAFEGWLVRHSIPVVIVVIAIPIICVTHALGRANRRLRVTIGPSGMQLRSGLFNHLRLVVDLEHIAAASTTKIERLRPLAGDWHSTTQRLTIATRTGPALRVSLADNTELAIAMPNPAEPAGVINSLLDRRATLGAGRDTPWKPPC